MLNGSKAGCASNWISTTRDVNVAMKWAESSGGRVVAIDLSKVQSTVINLSTDTGHSQYLKGRTATNWAKASVEVLIDNLV